MRIMAMLGLSHSLIVIRKKFVQVIRKIIKSKVQK